MLTPYRRHSRSCKYAVQPTPQEFTRCSCPTWCYGFVAGKEVRRALKLRDSKRALKLVAQWNNAPGAAGPVVTVRDAVDAFIRNREMRRMAPSTIASHMKTFTHLLELCGKQAIATVTVDLLTRFQESRVYTPNKRVHLPGQSSRAHSTRN